MDTQHISFNLWNRKNMDKTIKIWNFKDVHPCCKDKGLTNFSLKFILDWFKSEPN